MKVTELIVTFKKKNYKFNCLEVLDTTIIYNTKILNLGKITIDLNEINRYLNILSKNYEFIDDSIIDKKIVEYIEFIEIMQYNHQILKAKEQLMILIWKNLTKSLKNVAVKNFFEKNIRKMDDLKYYYFIFNNLVDIEIYKEINKSYSTSEFDWYLDNIGMDENDYPENNIVLDFVIF